MRTRRLVNGQFAGQFPSSFKGRGIEFAEVREYVDGDDIRSIDWNVSARAGRPFVKRHIEERNLTVMLAVDVSASTDFGGRMSSPPLASKRQRATEIALALGVAAIDHGDRAGLALFTRGLELALPPSRGRNTALQIAATLGGYQPRDPGTAFGISLAQVARLCRERSLLFVISDFLGDEQPRALPGALAQLAARHDVVPVWLHDRAEDTLPDVGLVALRDPESGRETLFDTSSRRVREAFERERRQHRETLVKGFRRLGLDFVRIETRDDWGTALGVLFDARGRARRRG